MSPTEGSKRMNANVQRVQGLRRGSTAQPHRNKSKYTRKTKHKNKEQS